MVRPIRLAVLALAALLPVARLGAQLTVPERTKGERTSSHAEVLAFIDSLTRRGAIMHVAKLTDSPQGRRVPYVILSRPLVSTPAAAKRTGKPILYIQANIHAGEVEGKEAMQMLARDLTLGKLKALLDSVVIIWVPIYNADGNDNWGPQARNRSEQNGPEIVGTRPNGQGFDLNRDYVKQEAPETRASLALVAAWDPDMWMDLHTTNGSFHGYALTWSPGLNANPLPANVWTQDTVLEAIRARVRTRTKFETYPYGNFENADSVGLGWRTYESYPRYGSNLMGMERVSILSEAFSHDPFLKRIDATYAFVLESVRYLTEHKADMRRHVALMNTWHPDSVVVRSDFARPRMDTLLYAIMRSVPADTAAGRGGGAAPGRGGRGGRGRQEPTGEIRATYMPVIDRFAATRKEAMPAAYLLDPQWSDVVQLMRRQGIVVEQTTRAWTGATSRFAVDSTVLLMPFQGHRPIRLEGRWTEPAADSLMARSYVVPTNQRFGVLAAFLLEPASEDGYATWNFFDRALPARGRGMAPVRRVMTLPEVSRVKVP